MANEKIVLAQLDIDIKGLIKAAQEATTALEAINSELKNLKGSGQESSQYFAEMQQQAQLFTKLLDQQKAALQEQIKQQEKLAETQKNVAGALHQTTEAQKNLTNSMAAGRALTAEYTNNAADATDAINDLNAALNENRSLMADNSGTENQVKTFNDYKEQVTESFNSINIFNGGLGGFISRAQEAGGVGPLVKGAFEGMSQGIMGMTRSSLAFIATPIGAVIAALGIVISAVVSYFKDTQEGIDKVTAVTRPLQSVFNALIGVFQNVGKYIADAFTNPKQAIIDFGTAIKDNLINRLVGTAELIPKLGKAIGLLFEGKFSQAGKVAADAVGKVALGTENITDKVAAASKQTASFLTQAYERGQKIDQLQKSLDKGMANYTKRNSELTLQLDKQNAVADNTNATFKQREIAATQAIATAKEHNRLLLGRMDTEIKLLKLKQEENGITDAEKANLAEMTAKRNESAAQYANNEKALSDKLGTIRQDAAAKEQEHRKKAAQENAQKLKLELDLLTENENHKTKTLEQELELAKKVATKKKAIADAEFAATDKTENDKIAKTLAYAKIDNELTQAQIDNTAKVAQAKVDAAGKEVQEFINANQSKLDDDKFFSQESYNTEVARLDSIAQKQKDFQQTRLTLGVINEQEYSDAIKNIDDANKATKDGLEAEKNEAEKAKIAIDLENKRAADTANMDYDLGFQLEKLDAQKTQELEAAEKTGADKSLIEAKYAKIEKDTRTAVMNNKLDLANSTFTSLQGILGKESAAGKAMAVAQATIDTYKSAVSAYSSMSGIPIVGPALGAVAAAAAVAAGIANVKKITSTKAPKAEKGALFSIGGNRHSNGGTMFTGADGTQFEAEKGELIGVMNRNAAAHFMAFNNAFPAGGGSAPNYFANGGIVSREIASPSLNIDELAAKIALANSAIPAPVVAVQDIITQGNSYVQVRDAANF